MLIYRINNEALTVKNICSYLYFLEFHSMIPKFSLNFTDTYMEIITIYSAHSTRLPFSGYTVIRYNIHTQKWSSVINLTHLNSSDTIYNILDRDYPYLITNNLLKINMDGPYIEYVLESDYIEDILEPSLNKFSQFEPNYRSVNIPAYIFKHIKYTLQNKGIHINDQAYDNFYERLHEHEQFVAFEETKQQINNSNYELPGELWNRVYHFYRQPLN